MIAGPSEQAKPLSTQEVKEVTDTAGQNKTSVKLSRPSGEKVEVDAKESAESLERGRRSWIIFSASGETPELRAFRPKANDKSGLIDLEVTVRSLPSGGTVKWSRPDPDAIVIDNPTSLLTRVRAMRPGRSAIDVSAPDSAGNQLESMKIQRSVPQFVTVDEEAGLFAANDLHVGPFDLDEEVMSSNRQINLKF